MKKILSERELAFFLVFVAFLISGYLYQQGKISFLPKKNNIPELENVVAEIPFTEKEYKLSYSNIPPETVKEIAKFEDFEEWIGDGEFDYSNYYEGKSSLSLSGQGHTKSKTSLELKKGFRLDDYVKFKLFVNLRTEPANIEDLSIILADVDSTEIYRYPIRELQKGWNLLVIPQKDFSPVSAKVDTEGFSSGGVEIKKISFELIPRPRTVASVNLDFFWAEKEEKYLEDWNSESPKLLSLGRFNSSLGLLVVGDFGEVASLKAIGSAKNYEISAKFLPLHPGFFGFFLRSNYKDKRGYYLGMDGIGLDSWQIYKVGTFDDKQKVVPLAKGAIQNFKLEEKKAYWLKAELKNDNLTFSLSVDGNKFIKIGEVNDGSFSSGGVGIAAVNSMFLVDDFQFSQ